MLFLSTLSLRRATRSASPWQAGYTDFYPRSPCGERPRSAGPLQAECTDFYPRSPCGERLSTVIDAIQRASISIHALLAESDILLIDLVDSPVAFLSTLSLRRATALEGVVTLQQYDFYPRSPCGERLP